MTRLQTNCFIATWASDFNGQLKLGWIRDKIENSKLWDGWDVYIVHAQGDNKNKHDHFHGFFKKIKGRCNFKNNNFLDIELDDPVIAVYEGVINTQGIDEKEELEVKGYLPMKEKYNDGDNWVTIEKDIESIYGKEYSGWKIIRGAHPNIQLKKHYGSYYHMVNYCYKQAISAWSNFDVEEFLKTEIRKMERNENNKQKKEERNFVNWIRKEISTKNYTKDELIKEIMKNENFNYYFMTKFYNYNSLIDCFFKNKPSVKPEPVWGKFIVPKELYDYLCYLDNWVMQWMTNDDKSKLPKRPKALFLSGKAKSGKTSLFASMGTMSYWCNVWNYDNYEAQTAFNIMDDYDGSTDYKGNATNDNGFGLLKPWIGGQAIVNISGKYRRVLTVANGRPLVFISNYDFDARFPNANEQKYWKESGAVIIDLGNNDLYTPKDTRTIGGFCKWVEFDTRNTWYYQTYIKKEEEDYKCLENYLNASEIENKEDADDFLLLSSDNEKISILEDSIGRQSDESDEPSPKKRRLDESD